MNHGLKITHHFIFSSEGSNSGSSLLMEGGAPIPMFWGKGLAVYSECALMSWEISLTWVYQVHLRHSPPSEARSQKQCQSL